MRNKSKIQPSVTDYYSTRESVWGYKLFLSNTRHFGYYDSPKQSPFPIRKALVNMEKKLFSDLSLPKDSLVLDAGAGVANVASFMAQNGLNVKAIDIVDWHIEIAKNNIKSRNLDDKISVSKMNYERLDFEENTFDGVYTMETFVHSQNPDKALKEFYRTLKPGGRLVLYEYDREADETIPAETANAFEQVNKYASMPTFQKFIYGMPEKMLEEAGFTNVAVRDMTPNIMPMLRLFYLAAYFPYQIIKLFRLQHRFVNAMSAVEYYRHVKYLRYISITANKPL